MKRVIPDPLPLKFIIIDTTNHNNIWQIGHPNKILFNAALSIPNAIVTDTISSYPINNNSQFIIKAMYGSYFNCYLVFYFKINTDSLKDFGTIEASGDYGATWVNIIKNPHQYGFTWSVTNAATGALISMPPDTIPFTGTSSGWYQFSFATSDASIISNDTVLYRITFHSDNIQENKEGWMIDNISYGIWEGINEFGDNSTTITPNPLTTSTQITFDKTYHNISFSLYDIQGKLMLQKQYADQSQIQLNREGLNNGMYFLKLTLDERWVETGKVIISE